MATTIMDEIEETSVVQSRRPAAQTDPRPFQPSRTAPGPSETRRWRTGEANMATTTTTTTMLPGKKTSEPARVGIEEGNGEAEGRGGRGQRRPRAEEAILIRYIKLYSVK